MQTQPSIKRIALYARVSSEEQREGQTIDSQIAELERFAKERTWVVIDVYRDEGWSGGILARPNMDRLRDDASRGIFDGVLVNDVDRVARDVAHLGVIKRDLERRGVQLIFRKLPAENSPMRNLMVNILGSFAEFEKELISDRTRRGKRHKAEVRKQFIGCLPPFGYAYVSKNPANPEGALRVNPQEATVVRQMYNWVEDEGLSARRVMNRLNQKGLRPRKGAPHWAKSSVLRVLRSSVYAGTWYFNKHESCEPKSRGNGQRYKKSLKSSNRIRDRAEWVPVPLPDDLQLISPDTWNRVQHRLDQNTAFSPRNAKHTYLLSGLVRCAGCKARFVGDPDHRRFVYRCYGRCKKVGRIKENTLNDAVWGAIEEAILDPDLIVDGVAAVHENQATHVQSKAAEHADAEKAMSQAKTEELRILEAYRLGVITADQLGQELSKIKERETALSNALHDLSMQETRPLLSKAAIRESVAQSTGLIAARLASLTLEEKQELLRHIVNEIVFDGSTASIRGVIPFARGQEAFNFPKLGEIATTASHCSGHNTGSIATTESCGYGRNTAYFSGPNSGLQFVITKSVPRKASKPVHQ